MADASNVCESYSFCLGIEEHLTFPENCGRAKRVLRVEMIRRSCATEGHLGSRWRRDLSLLPESRGGASGSLAEGRARPPPPAPHRTAPHRGLRVQGQRAYPRTIKP